MVDLAYIIIQNILCIQCTPNVQPCIEPSLHLASAVAVNGPTGTQGDFYGICITRIGPYQDQEFRVRIDTSDKVAAPLTSLLAWQAISRHLYFESD